MLEWAARPFSADSGGAGYKRIDVPELQIDDIQGKPLNPHLIRGRGEEAAVRLPRVR